MAAAKNGISCVNQHFGDAVVLKVVKSMLKSKKDVRRSLNLSEILWWITLRQGI